ncbi:MULTISPECIES: hypothetical protein [unclassified Pseudocitrobacter]|uniref:hypothetical protein n=1 Tax=unclassified Pseudocitrobacter TaxID=2638778 RepID=UPI0023E3B34C|nr:MULTISPECIES: hypothetical protein [unclassified Pseudocitrobacter]MDF3827826.1 hypothetical protein [Pseudocitrobacter sp. 2023EL-00150]MEC5373627.1 hypothetical protein [Pseudocitrobacter sp. MW920760]
MSNKLEHKDKTTGFRQRRSGEGSSAGVIVTKGGSDLNNIEVVEIIAGGEFIGPGVGDSSPRVFAGLLSDEELIAFLEDLIVKLMSRKHLTGKPEHLRVEASAIEEKLNATNSFIDSVVVRLGQNSIRTL